MITKTDDAVAAYSRIINYAIGQYHLFDGCRRTVNYCLFLMYTGAISLSKDARIARHPRGLFYLRIYNHVLDLCDYWRQHHARPRLDC